MTMFFFSISGKCNCQSKSLFKDISWAVIFPLACWLLCTSRNSFIFKNTAIPLERSIQNILAKALEWDCTVTTATSFENVGELEIAHISLDEPELEAIVFVDDGDADGGGDEASLCFTRNFYVSRGYQGVGIPFRSVSYFSAIFLSHLDNRFRSFCRVRREP
ncbi:hypothetical protein RHGRI_004852 [Rhododendron griersonianum]|uniref:Uncharacterized protein n=1 Tax=Rhododendron griersonianum TaxID=479676 RepID=A0AAV6LA55_9ERIC|nr:hypothetical protein RHGRI_004852 [Rhododendron griersonianum]